MNILSIIDVIDMAENLNIPCVPAKLFRRIEYGSLTGAKFIDLMYEFKAGAPSTMLRYEYGCADAMRSKSKKKKGWTHLSLNDLRGLGWSKRLQTLYDRYGDRARYKKGVTVVERPFVELLMHRNRPIEYRVYVHNGEVAGVSSKHNNNIPWSENILQEIIFQTSRIRDHVGVTNIFFDYDPNKPNFTLDFIVDSHRNVQLLDSGEPWHPKFNNQALLFGDRLPKGIALSLI